MTTGANFPAMIMAATDRVTTLNSPSRKAPSALALTLASVVALAACQEPGAPVPTRTTSRGLAGCGQVTFQGCCQGDTVWFCKSKKLQKISCAASPKCGWSTTYNVYDCGTAGTTDPSGKHAMPCSLGDAGLVGDGPAPGDATAKDAADKDAFAKDISGKDATVDTGPKDAATPADSGGCGGAMSAQGCCDGDTLWYCAGGKIKSINCAYNVKCGWDAKATVHDCGTAGAADPSGKHPLACSKLQDGGVAASDGPAPDVTSGGDAGLGCGKLTMEGCCDGETVWYCSAGKAQHYSCAGTPKCGWNSWAKWYLCGTKGTADPSGKFPRSCKGLLDDGGPPATDLGPPDVWPDLVPHPDLPPPDLPEPDAPDVGVDSRPDVTPDVTADAAAPAPEEEDEEGCGCVVGTSLHGVGTWTLLAALLLVAARRRRTR